MAALSQLRGGGCVWKSPMLLRRQHWFPVYISLKRKGGIGWYTLQHKRKGERKGGTIQTHREKEGSTKFTYLPLLPLRCRLHATPFLFHPFLGKGMCLGGGGSSACVPPYIVPYYFPPGPISPRHGGTRGRTLAFLPSLSQWIPRG